MFAGDVFVMNATGPCDFKTLARRLENRSRGRLLSQGVVFPLRFPAWGANYFAVSCLASFYFLPFHAAVENEEVLSLMALPWGRCCSFGQRVDRGLLESWSPRVNP